MTEFTYRSTIYGPQTFTVADEGGPVFFKGKQLSAFGGYMTPGSSSRPLFANAQSLEASARRLWQHRMRHLDCFEHKSNGVEP